MELLYLCLGLIVFILILYLIIKRKKKSSREDNYPLW